MGPRAGVYGKPVRGRRFPYEADHRTLGVRLPELEIQVRKFVPEEVLYVVEGHGSVDFGAAGAEGSKVHAVENEDLTQRSLRSPRELLLRSQAHSLRDCRCLRGARICARRVRLQQSVSC